MTNAWKPEPVRILMVEDNPDDVELAIEALRDAKLHLNLDVVENGEDALAYLRRQGAYTEAPRPDMVLLDLNLPRLGGHEVLAEIKRDADLCAIPVVVLTGSALDEDIVHAYESHANCYITKSSDFDQFVRIVKAIECFWFTVVKLPNP